MIRVSLFFTRNRLRKILYFPIIYQDLINKNRFLHRDSATNFANHAEIAGRGPYIITRRRPGRHDFRPDFVLTVNHLGVDREGVLAELLAAHDPGRRADTKVTSLGS